MRFFLKKILRALCGGSGANICAQSRCSRRYWVTCARARTSPPPAPGPHKNHEPTLRQANMNRWESTPARTIELVLKTTHTGRGLLELAGNAVRAINPRLLPTPPAGEEETGHDVCFLGVAGEDDYDKVVYCDDLPHGQRGIIGSWYLDPQRHAVEYVVIPMICFAVVRSVLPTIAKYPEKNAPKLNPPNAIKLLTLVTVIIQ
ncbi:hypothetical protein THAOC_07984, partial [Thalassiosira oceanica]